MPRRAATAEQADAVLARISATLDPAQPAAGAGDGDGDVTLQTTKKRAAKASRNAPGGESTRTAAAKQRFLRALASSPNVAAAARAAHIGRTYAYQLRERDATFAQAWDDAISQAVDQLEAVAFQRAAEVSDTLLIFLLKAHRPERYQEKTRHEHSGPDGAPIAIGLFTFDTVAARIAERSEADR